ncbi:MAG: flagellar filament protein FlaA [Treponema sp.]|uniref:flagellar filament outer layer protein FlaA n=1 Tax=Treponema sp. TaxID=166 RepID=UPI0025D55C33|nr:flagellar filament outer layer protein FlaA [Treponema sp.]MBQ8679231.1 flagellar filament protein FlaA [Treponema sp.]
MKKGVVVFTGFAFLLALSVPAVAQPSSKAVETRIIDNFDNVGSQDYQVPGKTVNSTEAHNWTWAVQASHYIDSEKGFPKLEYFEGQPNSLKLFNKEGDSPKVLGVKTSYLRKGENWFEVYPENEGKPYEIPFVGTVTQVDFWVWGANYLYYIDILIRDADGRVYTLPAGNLAFNGWRNVIVPIPSYIRQHSRLRSGPTTMTFVGFRVRTDPDEYVDDFNIFFDQLKFSTNALSNIFDGYELKNVEFGDSSSNGSTSSQGEAK